MATISDCRAVYGLSATGTPSSSNTTGSVTLGGSQSTLRYTTAGIAYTLRGIFATAGSILNLDLTTNDTTGSTAWVGGVAQVETATVTAAAGITLSGNATVTVTAAGMTGSPKAISVAVTTATHTTATLIATAIAAALNLDADYSAMFTATSAGATVITTRNPTTTYTVGAASVPIYAATDGTLNVALANGTCTGITAAPTSANTTAGTATSGVKIYDGDGKDFEGSTIVPITFIKSISMENNGQSALAINGATENYSIPAGAMQLGAGSSTAGLSCGTEPDLAFTAAGTTDLTITVIGE